MLKLTMSEDEYDEELPPISVNSSTCSASALWMPSAEELASQRAREAECERELLTLRAQHEVATLTDSSGSEGEAALAAAVSALVMPATPTTAADSAAPLPALLSRLVPDSPAFLHASGDVLNALTDDVCMCVEADRVQCEREVVLASAWLCAAAAGAGTGGKGGGRGLTRRARRALHHLLDSDAFQNISEESFQRLKKALVEMTSPIHIRMEMADVLTCIPDGSSKLLRARKVDSPDGLGEPGGPGDPVESPGPQTRLALALLWATVSETLGVNVPQNTSSSGCACALASAIAAGGARPGSGAAAGTVAAAVGARAVGRLARLCRTPRECATAAAVLLAPNKRKHAPHELEMLVNASKLQLLFRE